MAKKNVKGLDLGTSRIVTACHAEDGYEYHQELNAFVEIPYSRITVNMLKKNGIPPSRRRLDLLCVRQRRPAVCQYDRRRHAAADA
jgi:hypothetical protein